MKKALLSVLISLLFSMSLVEPFLVYADSDSFDSVNYDLVDYVSPNGNNVYINTGYKPKSNTQVYAVFSTTANTSGRFLYGVASSSNSYGFNIGTDYRVRTLNGTSNTSLDGIFPVNTVVTINQGLSGTTATDGNTTYSASYTQGNSSLNSNMYIFCLNASGSTTNFLTGAKLYELKIYESSSLVHHYYPCKRKSDNVVGVYDGIANTFISGSGGSLSYGSVVSANYTITTSVSPSGSGTVSGGGSYASGSTVTLTATASSGYVFSKWSDDNTSNPRTITVTSDQSYEAIFELESTPVPTYTISTSVSPAGSGTVQGGGSYNSGVSVILTALPSSGFSFVKWSDNVTVNPRTIVVSSDLSLTAIFEEESSDPDPDQPTPPAGWTDWTDEDDSEYLDEINNIDLSKIYWSVNYERINDFVQIYQTQYNVNTSGSGSAVVSIYGHYYDNTITALTSCNSTSYTVSSESHTIDTMVYVQPAVYGSLDTNVGQPGEDIIMNFAMDIQSGLSGNETYTTTNVENMTQACRLVGMNTGDGSIDGSILLANGYEKKTLTYNDGTNHPPTATFYVPGNEVIDLDLDLSFLNDLLDSLYIQVVNNTKVLSHDEFTIRFHGKDGYLFPEYGHVHADTFLGVLLSSLDFNSVHPFIGRISNRFYLIPQDSVYSKFNDTFSYHISDNMYDKNYVDLYWQGTRNPVWKFKTNSYESSLLNGTFRANYRFENDYGGYIDSVADSYTIQNSDLTIDSNLTAGAVLKVGLASVNMYNFKSNSLLNRFNQLGSMMYGWFNRIYQAIGNITGGNESNDIINNVVNDYDVDVEVNFNGLLSDVFTKKQNINLTDPEYVIPSGDHSAIHSLAEAMEKIYDEVYIDNGIGIVVFAPLILLVLRLIL